LGDTVSRIPRRAGGGTSPALLASVVLAIALAGCGRATPPEEVTSTPLGLDVDVRADSGAIALHVEAPFARVWVERVDERSLPAAVAPAPANAPDAELPDARPAPLPRELPPAPALVVDPDLKPPVPRLRAPLDVPPSRPPHATSVEVDVLVDEHGEVSDAVWAGGEDDAALVRAALDCARAMAFYPALRAGQPVAVWCRQRFDFSGK